MRSHHASLIALCQILICLFSPELVKNWCQLVRPGKQAAVVALLNQTHQYKHSKDSPKWSLRTDAEHRGGSCAISWADSATVLRLDLARPPDLLKKYLVPLSISKAKPSTSIERQVYFKCLISDTILEDFITHLHVFLSCTVLNQTGLQRREGCFKRPDLCGEATG